MEEAAWAGAALLEGVVQLPDLGLSPAKEGNDLYIVWNETFNSDRFSLDPVASFSQERTLLVKYSHTLTLGL